MMMGNGHDLRTKVRGPTMRGYPGDCWRPMPYQKERDFSKLRKRTLFGFFHSKRLTAGSEIPVSLSRTNLGRTSSLIQYGDFWSLTDCFPTRHSPPPSIRVPNVPHPSFVRHMRRRPFSYLLRLTNVGVHLISIPVC